MENDCFDCLDINSAIKKANKGKGNKAVLVLDELNSLAPNDKESTESQANRIIAGRKITKQNKRRGN